jgi:MFS family permease
VIYTDRDDVLGNARLANFEADLGLSGYDYNGVLSAFYVSYILFEIPANMACKWIGPGWFLPGCTVGFGLISLCNAFVTDRASASAVRFLLGAFEAGILPGLAYYLSRYAPHIVCLNKCILANTISRWYRRSELVFRISLFIVSAPLAGAFGGLLSSGILRLPPIGSLHSWRLIFFIEGIVTTGLGIIFFFTLTDRPATAKWLSDEEKRLAVARIQSELVGSSEVLDKIDRPKLMRGIFSPVTLATSMIFLLDNITVQGLSIFAPTIIRTIYPRESVVTQQLYTAPLYIAGAITTLAISFLSWKTDRRLIYMLTSAPLMVAGYIIFLATTNPQARYAATFVIAAGAFPFGSLANAQVAANVVSDTARSSAIATNVMMGNIGGLVSTWSFIQTDAPNYPIGNGLNLASSAAIIIIGVSLLLWMAMDNRKRAQVDTDAQLATLSQEQLQSLDWKHPDFRWRP